MSDYDGLLFADMHFSNDNSIGHVDKFGVNTFLRKLEGLFCKMVDRAAREDLVLISCGDLVDSASPDPATSQVLHRCLCYVIEKGVEFLAITGNHGFDGLRSVIGSYGEFSKRKVLPNITLVSKPKVVTIGDTAFYCVPYIGRDAEDMYRVVTTFIKRANSVADKGKNKILLLHYPIVGCRFNVNSIRLSTGFNLKSLLKKEGNPFKFIAAGDFHDRQGLKGVPNFLYLGQPYQGDFGDAGTKRGYTLLNFSTAKRKFVRSKCPQFMIVDNVSKPSDIKGDLENKVVRVLVEPGTDQRGFSDRCYKLGAYRVQTRTKRVRREPLQAEHGFKFDADHSSLVAAFGKSACPEGLSKKKFTRLGLGLYKEAFAKE